ncbi:MAG: hypothetical protein KDB61_11325, partial [Planctomycetes bacterium]|nr:hypothetical protein [Planctomycetota bacterium]
QNAEFQDALTREWRQREQNALTESRRLAGQVEALIERVDRGREDNLRLTGELALARAQNATYQRNLQSQLVVWLARNARRCSLGLGLLTRP